MKTFVSGTLESGDVMITLSPSDKLSVEINSAVQSLYGEAIRKTVESVLEEKNIKQADVFVNDNGARDFVIRARLASAINKMNRG